MVVIILSESVLQPPNGVGSNPAAGRTELKNKMHNCLNFHTCNCETCINFVIRASPLYHKEQQKHSPSSVAVSDDNIREQSGMAHSFVIMRRTLKQC